MPKMLYKPTNHVYDFDLEDLLWAEVRAIQKVTGAAGLMNIGELLENADGSVIPAILWVLRKREEPTLTFADLDGLRIGDVEMLGDDEDEVEDEGKAKPSESPPEEPPTAAEPEPRVRLAT